MEAYGVEHFIGGLWAIVATTGRKNINERSELFPSEAAAQVALANHKFTIAYRPLKTKLYFEQADISAFNPPSE